MGSKKLQEQRGTSDTEVREMKPDYVISLLWFVSRYIMNEDSRMCQSRVKV